MKDLIRELITYDTEIKTPVYLQLANAFIQNISQGRIRKGLKLPGSRTMSQILMVNRMTVVAAYDELEAQGWIEKVSRKGTFISNSLPLLKPKKISTSLTESRFSDKPAFLFYDKKIKLVPDSARPKAQEIYLNDGFPDPRLTPVDTLMQTMRSIAKRPANRRFLMYGNAQGVPILRETLANYLSDTRGLSCQPENILISRGAQMGLYMAASLLVKPGDHIIVGRPGYPGATITFSQLGAKIHEVPLDQDGIDIDAVSLLCAKKSIRMIYVIPHHHNPTTVTLSPERRIHLLELARKYRFAILEDDYDYDFHYRSRPMLPIASIDNQGSVIYIGTLTKTLAPSIRIGFIVAPAAFIEHATSFRKMIDTQGDSLLEMAIAEMFKDGSLQRHVKKSLAIYRERRDYFCELLKNTLGEKVNFQIPDGGMSVWTTFITQDLTSISLAAAKKGLKMSNGTEFETNGHRYNSARLGFASVNYSEQEKAVQILKQVISTT